MSLTFSLSLTLDPPWLSLRPKRRSSSGPVSSVPRQHEIHLSHPGGCFVTGRSARARQEPIRSPLPSSGVDACRPATAVETGPNRLGELVWKDLSGPPHGGRAPF